MFDSMPALLEYLRNSEGIDPDDAAEIAAIVQQDPTLDLLDARTAFPEFVDDELLDTPFVVVHSQYPNVFIICAAEPTEAIRLFERSGVSLRVHLYHGSFSYRHQ